MSSEDKRKTYEEVVEILEKDFAQTGNRTARMAQVSSLLIKHFGGFFWTGFYQMVEGELTVGPYQGAHAAPVLPNKRGVCWTCMQRGELVNVPNVHEFKGHIRVEGPSNSELSVPLLDDDGTVYGVMHIDAADFNAFDEMDEEYLTLISKMI